MSNRNLSHICPYRLNETYQALYEKQHKLGISDEYLLNTNRSSPQDDVARTDLIELLKSSRAARDNVITWYLKQNLVELNVTISLLTAKIKFIEYKLGLCDGLDLHQACSLSLIDFCNIIADLTVIKTSPSQRKTLHKVSAEVDIPVWLSHYRNQICHVPSAGPCIAILVPLVQKSLQYLRDTFWSKVLERESFDEKRLKRIVSNIVHMTQVACSSKSLRIKKGAELAKRRMKQADKELDKYAKICVAFRRSLVQNRERSLEVTTSLIVTNLYEDPAKNNALLMTQVINAKCFEPFVFKLVALAEQRPADEKIISWLKAAVLLVGSKDEATLRENMTRLEIDLAGLIKLVDISPIKCCQIAYRLLKLDRPIFRALLTKLRYRLLPILGKKKLMTLIKMTAIVAHNSGSN